MNENMGINEQVAVSVVRHNSILSYLVLALIVVAGVYVYLVIRQRREKNGSEISVP